ncbi:glycosyltransferase [Desulfovibrio inopinatus]|uniref:glycosyltransferase n=1 Tax=Desulfovibrio inopinatus TaxID=102109 RepID=UPI00040FA4EC|nr:glycosyltransferase [Desulfovibrio inopinatus]
MKTVQPVLGMVLKGYPRISETFISNEIYLLEKAGIRIHIISMREPRENFTHRSVQRIKADITYLPDRILPHLHRLAVHNLCLLCITPRRYVKTAGFMVKQWLKTRRSATLKHFLQAGYFVNKLRTVGITHLHAHFAHSPTSVALFGSRLANIPFSFTGHAKDVYTQDPEKLARKIDLAQFVVTCTGANKTYLESIASNHHNINVVHHGIDLHLFTPQHDKTQPHSPARIISVARLTAKKGLATVFEALGKLHKGGLDFRYTIIGTGEDREMLETLATRLGIQDMIDWRGVRPHEDVVTALDESDVFVLGCQVLENGDRDGIPNVLVESMAMGLPVVATRVSAIPELVEDEVSGLLVSQRDPDALAHALQRLLTDIPLRKRIIENAKQNVSVHFDNTRLIAGLVSIFAKNTQLVPLKEGETE